MKAYKIFFDFTTVHGNRFVGRSGEFEVNSKDGKINPLDDDLIKCCAQEIHQHKPKWNIIMITIKDIVPIHGR